MPHRLVLHQKYDYRSYICEKAHFKLRVVDEEFEHRGLVLGAASTLVLLPVFRLFFSLQLPE